MQEIVLAAKEYRNSGKIPAGLSKWSKEQKALFIKLTSVSKVQKQQNYEFTRDYKWHYHKP